MQNQYKSNNSNGLKVLLLIEHPHYDHDLQNALLTCGYHVYPRLTTCSILKVVDEVIPDVIILDVDKLSNESIHSLVILNQIDPKPMVVFTEFSDQIMIQKLLNSQINAYIVGDKLPHHVGPTIQVAIARFKQVQSLQSELIETKRKLDGRKWIDKAKGILMQHKGLSEDQAYKTLRKMAMDNSQKMDDVAKNIVSVMQAVN
ncbi:ANTAR domain-containing response regulator [Catenovulum adriaticum]|uniref:ANTAR domain-containing protein n=1 Tax=Catenovulum adriaticum TaxID=2984846 RepID=A0ABY7AR94_9ALTE|nr:ANTAR domain-containing protein [Catenovulum sp. TS8]WAJ70864.1 ANTAR domain-containing protein [Catenovulum sp. TS8]